MSALHTKNIESSIWERLLHPQMAAFSMEAARAILAIEFPESDKERIDTLAKKARRGALTADEQDEIDSYGRIGSFISIMKSKARVALRTGRGSGPAE